jgi:hypothetical protein
MLVNQGESTFNRRLSLYGMVVGSKPLQTNERHLFVCYNSEIHTGMELTMPRTVLATPGPYDLQFWEALVLFKYCFSAGE